MQEARLNIPQMLLIGSTGRNSGKTTFAAAGIKRWKSDFPIIGLKITSVDRCDGMCPRGGEGCGACSSLRTNFDLAEEKDASLSKDTSVLLAAGCQRVYWLRTLKTHIGEAIRHFMAQVPENALIVCESNSLRNVATPGLFIMMHNSPGAVKASAGGVIDSADIVLSRGVEEGFDDILSAVKMSTHGGRMTVGVKSDAALSL